MENSIEETNLMGHRTGDYEYEVSRGSATITKYHGNGGNISLPSTLGGYPVAAIGNCVFAKCTSLTSVTIPDSVTGIGDNAFAGCTSLTSVTIPDSVTGIGKGVFANCTSMTSVTIGGGVTSIGGSAFYQCTCLTSIIFLGLIKPTDVGGSWIEGTNVSIMGHAHVASTFPKPGEEFLGMIMGDDVVRIAGEYEQMVDGGNATITKYHGSGGEITIPSALGGNPVVRIGDKAFSSCTSLTSVTIPDSVTSIGDGAFTRCTSLTSISFLGLTAPTSIDSDWRGVAASARGHAYADSNFPAPGKKFQGLIMGDYLVRKMGDYEYSISGGVATITGYTGSGGSITLPSILGGYLVAIGSYAFHQCTSLTSVTMPEGITSIGDGAFARCTSLTSVTIPDSVTTIGDHAFHQCTSLTSVTIGSGVSNISTSPLSAAFSRRTSLTSVTIGAEAFSSCTSLTYVTIPDSVTGIGAWAFSSCTSLASVTIGSGVMTIDNHAFESCTALTSVTIQGGVNVIGDGAFEGDFALTSISFLGLTAPACVGSDWIGLAASLRGHAYADSNFPAPGKEFQGLIMGSVIPNVRGKIDSPEKGGSVGIPDSSSVGGHPESSESPKESVQLDSNPECPVERDVRAQDARKLDIKESITGVCPRCGCQIGHDYSFCIGCGCKVGEMKACSHSLTLER